MVRDENPQWCGGERGGEGFEGVPQKVFSKNVFS